MKNDYNISLYEKAEATIQEIFIPSLCSIILPLLKINPAFGLPFILANGFFGISMQFKVKKMDEFIKRLNNNIESFPIKLLESEDFIDGFVLILDEYLKERNFTKRETIFNIFMGFTKLDKEKRENFDLERLLDINKKIMYVEVLILKYLSKIGVGSIFVNLEVNLAISIEKVQLESYKGEKIDDILSQLSGLGLINKRELEEYGDQNTDKSLDYGVIVISGKYFGIFFTKLGLDYLSFVNKK